MKTQRLLALIFIIGALLTACSNSLVQPESISGPPLPAVDDGAKPASQDPASAPAEVNQPGKQVGGSSVDQTQGLWPDGEIQLDEQGYVEVAVTPLNLNAPDGNLNFSVGLNTHSVDLSMDLAQLATLEADNGLMVQANLWDAPLGGHHVSGVLSFPAVSEGASLLEGASHLTLKIRDVDAPERSFTWSLTG
jgi:hypothetical protein